MVELAVVATMRSTGGRPAWIFTTETPRAQRWMNASEIGLMIPARSGAKTPHLPVTIVHERNSARRAHGFSLFLRCPWCKICELSGVRFASYGEISVC
jgi:hypothetical protein